VSFTETQIDMRGFPDAERQAIQQRADEWGVSFDDACLRLLLEASRALQAQRPATLPGLIARLFGNRSTH